MKPLIAAAKTDELLEPKVRDARARIAFYASTPAYHDAFEHLGLGDLTEQASALSKQQDWDKLPALIDDETLEQFAVIGTYDEIASRVADRWSSVVTDVEFSISISDDRDRQDLARIVREVQGAGEDAARRAVVGNADDRGEQ